MKSRSKMKLKEMPDYIFSHNQIVALWEDCGDNQSKLLWRGMTWDIPNKYAEREAFIFGCVVDKISESDSINIELF